MGLDLVEIIIAAEKAFDITLGDKACARCDTLGDLHSCILSALRQRRGDAIDPAAVWAELCNIVADIAAIDRGQVCRNLRLADLS